MIVRQARGDSGFGYDPVFYVPMLGKTMAELTSEEKNRISHRSVAARKASEALGDRS
jgi:XTP/dITP diphosphohydrolase|tara:strand:- start:4061 stop:4231 length:171 start_codon:yes stop_codon:yes gene_type:complete